MENEMEKLFLLGKVIELINQAQQSDKPITSKFQKLKTILEDEVKNTPSSSSKLTKEKLYNLNNFLNEWQSKQNLSLESLICTHERALDKILEELSIGDTSQSQPHPQNGNEGETRNETYRWSNQYVDEKGVFGIKDKGVFLRRLILPEPHEKDKVVFREFGLVGMRGIGKTTLAQMVFNHPDVRSHFLPRVWVCVSKQPGDEDPRKEIVKRMLRSLGVEDEIIDYADKKHELKGLLYSLRQQLLGKRYLIVLDDVCNEDEDYLSFVSSLDKNIGKCEEKLAYGLPKDCGGAVIVTSRSEEIVGKLVGDENLHRVLPLSDDDCWEIFKNTYEEEGKKIFNNTYMESLQKKIKEKCYGLPLGAKMMGEIAKKTKLNKKTGNFKSITISSFIKEFQMLFDVVYEIDYHD